MKIKVQFLALLMTCLALTTPAIAQDAPTEGAASKVVDFSLKVDSKLNKKRDETNYIFYFLWIILQDKGLDAVSLTACTGEKWMKSSADKYKRIAITSDKAKSYKAKVKIDIKVRINYREIKFKQGNVQVNKGHQWIGSVKGTLKDSQGKVIHKFDLKHAWGTNELTKRKDGRVSYMRQMAQWVALDLLSNKEFAALISEDKAEALERDLTKFKEDKKNVYDPSTGDKQRKKDAQAEQAEEAKKEPNKKP